LETYNLGSPCQGVRAWPDGVVRCGDRLQEGRLVPRIEVEDAGTFDVEEGKRLVLAIEEDAGVDILHRCGSYARCTTCRIQYLEGEPEKMTRAELEVLESRNLLGEVRLSCQALCDHDIKVRVLLTVESTGLDGPGPHPESHITPEPEWVDKPA
jgi:ferredoxin